MATLADILSGPSQEDYLNNPYYAGGVGLIKQEAPVVGDGFWGAFLPRVGMSFAGGLAMGVGQAKEDAPYSRLSSALSANPDAELSDVIGDDPMLSEKFGRTASALAIQESIERRKRLELLKDKLQETQFEEWAKGNPDLVNGATIGEDGQIKYPERKDTSIAKSADEQLASKPVKYDGETFLEMEKRLTAELTPLQGRTQAALSARAAVNDLRKNRAKEFERIDADRDSEKAIDEMIMKGREGIAKAGSTGPWNKASRMLEYGMSLWPGQGEPEENLEGDAKLLETQALAKKMAFIKGEGALSQKETDAYQRLGMSPDHPKAVNEDKLRTLEQMQRRIKEYNSFRNTVMENFAVSPQKAQMLWEQYREANPLFIFDPKKKEYVPNVNAVPWTDYDFTGKSQAKQDPRQSDAYKRLVEQKIAEKRKQYGL